MNDIKKVFRIFFSSCVWTVLLLSYTKNECPPGKFISQKLEFSSIQKLLMFPKKLFDHLYMNFVWKGTNLYMAKVQHNLVHFMLTCSGKHRCTYFHMVFLDTCLLQAVVFSLKARHRMCFSHIVPGTMVADGLGINSYGYIDLFFPEYSRLIPKRVTLRKLTSNMTCPFFTGSGDSEDRLRALSRTGPRFLRAWHWVASVHACFNVTLTFLVLATSTGVRPLSSTMVTSAPCLRSATATWSWPLMAWKKLCQIQFFNSMAPGKFEWNFRSLIFPIISVIDSWGISCEIGLRWMPLDLTDDKSTMVQVMGWCRQATSHYLSQCWPRLLSPYSVTRPQWVNLLPAELYILG